MCSPENCCPSEGETVIIGSNVISDCFNMPQSKKMQVIINIFKYCFIIDEEKHKHFTLVIRDEARLARRRSWTGGTYSIRRVISVKSAALQFYCQASPK